MPRIIKNQSISPIVSLKETVKRRFSLPYKTYYGKTTSFIKARPLLSLALIFGLFIAVLFLGKVLEKKNVEAPKKEVAKAIEIYSIGESPKAVFQAKIEKSGVVKIIAQTSGVVQNISVTEGQEVGQGQQLISLSTNYQGGNAASVQRQVAQTQYQNVLDTFDLQKGLIGNQRDVATASAENAQKMRDIAHQSSDDTNSLIDNNQRQLDALKGQLSTLSPTPENAETIATLQGSISQLESAILQLRSSQRSVDYQGKNDTPQALLSSLQKDIALKQLDVQDKSLGLNKEVSKLQVSLAYINEATMYPASPFSGKVERVYVHEGDLVNPGTVLATVTSSELKTIAVLSVPERVASILSQGEPSELLINDKKIAITPYYVSSQATDGQMYSVFYCIPEEYQSAISNGEYISINVPVGVSKEVSSDPFVPVDAVYQTQDNAFVLLAGKGKAESKVVKLGTVFGSYVEVLSGLTSGDHVILNRNVVAGDKVTIN
jgi:multidrug efflux pump subunit AcrA (membrane-fusion protein)